MRQYKTYRHYKGGLYFVLGDGLHTETEEMLTLYVCAVSGAIFCRPKTMFDEQVQDGDYSGPRFIPLPDGTTKDERKAAIWPVENKRG